MTAFLDDLSPEAVLPAMDANLGRYSLTFGRWPGGEVHDDAALTWFVSGEPDRWYNGVVRADLRPEEVAEAVESVLVAFRRRGLPMLWHIGPTTRPTTLGSALHAHGLRSGGDDEPGMALDLGAMREDLPVPDGLTVERVADEEGIRLWVATWMFGAPDRVIQHSQKLFSLLGVGSAVPWDYYLARLNGEPAATIKLFYEAGVVGVEHVATVPHLRRKGIGTALTVHALREARDRGYRVAVLTSSPQGFNSYRRIGFTEYCTVTRFSWHPEGVPG